MAITIPIQYVPTSPTAFVCGFNPIIYQFVFDLGSPVPTYSNLKAYVKLYDRKNSDALIGTWYYDAVNSGGTIIATADISKQLQYYLLAPQAITSGDYRVDPNMMSYIKVGFGVYYLDGTNTPVIGPETFFALDLRTTYAVAQIGESKNMGNYRTVPELLLSDFDKVYMFQYAGAILPGELDFITPSSFTTDLIVGSSGGTVLIPNSAITDDVIHVKHQAGWANTEVFVSDIASAVLSQKKWAKLIQIRENPCFMRWINQRGGRDYWCFDKRQTIADETGEIKTVRHYIEDPYAATKTHTKIDASKAVKITAGATNLTPVQWQVINWIAASPLVQYYDIDKAVWYGVIVESSKNNRQNDRPAARLEFTFPLPEYQLQY